MLRGELVQPDDRGEEMGGDQQYGQPGQQGGWNRGLQDERGEQGYRQVQPEQHLGVWEGQRVPGQDALAPGGHLLPGALAKGLHEPLAPPGALADELTQRRWRLLLGDVPVVVDHPHPLAQRADSQTDVSVLGQVVLVPATDGLQHLPGEEDGVAAERDGTVPGVKMQPAAEPEEVLQHVERGVPVGVVVHQLHTGLHDPDPFGNHDRVHDAEDFRMDLVLGVEDRDHSVASMHQRDIEPVRLVHRAVVEDNQLDVVLTGRTQPADGGGSAFDGADVVGGADDDDLDQPGRIICVCDPVDCGLDDVLLVPGRHDGGEGKHRRSSDLGYTCERLRFRLVPGVDHEVEGVCGLNRQQQRDQADHRQQDGLHSCAHSKSTSS